MKIFRKTTKITRLMESFCPELITRFYSLAYFGSFRIEDMGRHSKEFFLGCLKNFKLNCIYFLCILIRHFNTRFN